MVVREPLSIPSLQAHIQRAIEIYMYIQISRRLIKYHLSICSSCPLGYFKVTFGLTVAVYRL